LNTGSRADCGGGIGNGGGMLPLGRAVRRGNSTRIADGLFNTRGATFRW